MKASLVDYAIEEHHTGLPALAREHTGCAESTVELVGRFVAEGASKSLKKAKTRSAPVAGFNLIFWEIESRGGLPQFRMRLIANHKPVEAPTVHTAVFK
jgi:hypothetical protein